MRRCTQKKRQCITAEAGDFKGNTAQRLCDLKEVLLEDCDMKRKPEMMAKVKELEALLKAEQEDFDKGE